MKNQGVVKFFALALVLVCIYQLSFTWKAYSIEKEAKEATNDNPVLTRRYLDSISSKEVYNLGVVNFTYSQIKERQLNLGLDLQGGMNVVMEISVVDIIKSLSNNNKNEGFNKAIEAAVFAKEQQPSIDLISEFRKQFNALNPNLTLAAIFANQENASDIRLNTADGDVIAFIRKEASESIDRSFQILKTRIDQFGVTQPTIQLLSNSGRVMVELPGADNPERVRRLLQNTAKLEFWNTYSNMEFSKYLDVVNKALEGKYKQDSTATKDTATNSVVATMPDTTNLSDSVKKRIVDSIAALDTAKKKQDASADYLGKSGFIYNIYKDEKTGQGMLSEGSRIGYAKSSDTAKVNAIFNSPEIKNLLPGDIVFAWAHQPNTEGSTELAFFALKTESNGLPALDGDVVTDARPTIGQLGDNQVSMSMNLEGSNKWEDITAAAAAANPKKCIAVVLDGVVYSDPVVNGKISGGQTSIEGKFSIAEAKDLANILKAGKLPAPARIVEEALVGPSLGKKAIQSGLLSILIGFLSVILIVYLIYNTAGIIADLAVLLNLFFIIGTLASFQAALTLPGIAGIILTLGMAVDANVLIYERIKEELALGRNFRNAVSSGFKNAASAIIDSNLTTLLTAVVLYVTGTGPIAGFAITLIIGIISSLFTAFLLTRVVFENYIKKDKEVKFWFPFSKTILQNSNFDFIGKSKIFYTVSAVVILLGIGSMFTRGFDLGVDFKGGWSYVVKIEKPTNSSDIRKSLGGVLGTAPEVKAFGTDNSFKITTTYLINSQDIDAGKKVQEKLNEGLTALNVGKAEILTSYQVGPTVADDIKQSAIASVFLALLGMFIYIQIRFRRWQFALATVIMLVHDVMLVLSLFSLLHGIVPFTLEIDQAFIAAILTVIGYSINDSVVVFDRVREYLREHKKEEDTYKVINMALNSTLSRTILTSLTTIVVVFIVFLFGGETIKGFAFALTTGIVLGTYSSLCIGSPLSAQLIKRKIKKN